jgi:tetratricopeptide (TPR) repeat protein/KaiC/GvpD/RAD55 family RecA-like ATPase
LESAGKNGKLQLSDLAYHYEKADNREKAIKYALAAGQDEVAKWSNTQAIRHFRYVLQNISEGHVEEKRTALDGLGDAYASNCMYGEAIKKFDELAASETGKLRLRAIRKASDAAYAEGDKPDLLLEYVKKAQELAVSDRLEMARIVDNRGKAWGWAGRGDYRMDVADYDAALQVFEEENSVADAAEALWRSGAVCVAYFSLPEKGLGELLRSAAIFRELGDVRKEIETMRWIGQGFLQSGLFPEARREFAEVLRIGEKLAVFTDLIITSYRLSIFDAEDGRLAEALSNALKGLEFSKKTDSNWPQGVAYASLVQTYSLLGNFKNADEHFDRLSKLPPGVLSNAQNLVLVPFAKAVYFAAKACWPDSNKSFEKVLEYTETMSIPGMGALIRKEYARALEKQGRVEETKVQREKAQKFLGQVEERFGHANVQLSLMVPRKIKVGEDFEMRLDLVNVARTAATLTKIEGVTPTEFNIASLPSFSSLQDGSIAIKEKSVGPFHVETIKLKMKATKAGSFELNPEVLYMNDLAETKTFRANPVIVTVQQATPAYEILPGRITTGTTGLDELLVGGVPEKYAVVLAAPASNERQLLVKRYLEEGINSRQTTLYITCETGTSVEFAAQFQSNFNLLFCSPQADLIVQNLPNVYKLKGIDNLTEIDIALTKFLRTLNPSQTGTKRACIDLISDVLLQHHAVVVRKWLSGLLANLKSKGFTTLAVIDPQMHTSEESRAIISLFDGEITISERETARGLEKILKVRKLVNQKYLEDELNLTKEKLSQ